MKRIINRKLIIILGLAVLLMLVTTTLVYAAFVQEDGSIRACVLKDGTLYILNSSTALCKKTETLITWNVIGPAGQNGQDGADGKDGLSCWDLNGNGIKDANEDINKDGKWDALDCMGQQGEPGLDGKDGINGLDGKDGLNGLNGADGAPGEKGDPGPASISALQGTDCTVGDKPGKIDISVDPTTGVVSIICVHQTYNLIIHGENWDGHVFVDQDYVCDVIPYSGNECTLTYDANAQINEVKVYTGADPSDILAPSFLMTCPDGTQATSTSLLNSMPPLYAQCPGFTMNEDKLITINWIY